MTIRDEVAEELEILSVAGGILHSKSARSTWRMYGDSLERLRVWESVAEEYLDADNAVVVGGRMTIATAGPPGAGKSTLVQGIAGYRNIDADLVKPILLRIEGEARTYDGYLQRQLADGLPIMPNELGGLVHDESVQIAEFLRDRCMRRGENVILQGTLAHPPVVDEVVYALAIHGYEQLHVRVADMDRATALERVRVRWWEGRCDSSSAEGGRFIPREAIDRCFDDIGSVCVRNARTLITRVNTALPHVVVSFGERPFKGDEGLRLVDGPMD